MRLKISDKRSRTVETEMYFFPQILFNYSRLLVRRKEESSTS